MPEKAADICKYIPRCGVAWILFVKKTACYSGLFLFKFTTLLIYILCRLPTFCARVTFCAKPVLLKLIDSIRTYDGRIATKQSNGEKVSAPALFPETSLNATRTDKPGKAKTKTQEATASRSRTGLFGKSMLQEAIEMLPQLPDTESLDEA